jgi:hypothetical protein
MPSVSYMNSIEATGVEPPRKPDCPADVSV